MPKITIEVSDQDAANLTALARQCNAADSTHGTLDVAGLLGMLAQDAAAVIARPGSWEGTAMAQLLASHGYAFG